MINRIRPTKKEILKNIIIIRITTFILLILLSYNIFLQIQSANRIDRKL